MKRSKQDPRKAELDKKTTYMTLLPDMEEGFHTGYQTQAGIVSDGSRKPHEWLESFAMNIHTEGEDVGYSIPDVLAGEAQLRRLMRLPHREAMSHQEMIDWRAVLALVLLWDGWAKDDTWPELTCEEMLTGHTFIRGVRAALPPRRLAFGLRLFVLSTQRDGVPERKAIGMLSPTVALAPAANSGDLSALLPQCVRWYLRDEQRFDDPCAYLDEADRARLVQHLRFLQALGERVELGSPLYSADASLSGLIDRYIDDLQTLRSSWRERLEAGDANAKTELYIRALAVYGLYEVSRLPGVTRREIAFSQEELTRNVLLRWFAGGLADVPPEFSGAKVITYDFHGKPFAVASPRYLLEPANTPEETQTLKQLWAELSLPLQYNGAWNRAVARRFVELSNHMTGLSGVDHRASRKVIELLRYWSNKLGSFREAGDRSLTLQLPMDNVPSTLAELAQEMVGLADTGTLAEAFSDCLLLCEGASPFDDPELTAHCAVQGAENLYAVPPIGPKLALWLTRIAEELGDDAARPRLPAQSFRFAYVDGPNGRVLRAQMTLTSKRHNGEAVMNNEIVLIREYTPGTAYTGGAAVRVATEQLPAVRYWPAVRLSAGQWMAYFVLAQQTGAVDVLVPAEAGWAQGEPHQAVSGSEGQAFPHSWQTARIRHWPLYVALSRGTISLGALPNEETILQLKRESAAAVAVDFGSNATTVMLRQGGQLRPAELPAALLKTLLHARMEDDRLLADEFIPETIGLDPQHPSTFVSAMDMFTDDEKQWIAPLLDGHIYYPPDLNALLGKNPNALYYDLKWSEEPHVVRCLRLFLKQVMLQAALAARLAGSPSLSWRVSMPNAMPLYRQEAYLDMARALAKETTADTGVPLSADMPPVLFASENTADGLYFRSRNEVNTRSGFLNMDVGGSTTDMSVWLGGGTQAAVEASLLLGCRQILFDSLSARRREAFETDFADAPIELRALVGEMIRSFVAGQNSLRMRQKNVFLLDSFFARHSEAISDVMASIRGEGRVSMLESLLLLNFGFLFRLCGELLDRCEQREDTRALLSPRMEICVAGNGGQFLKVFDRETRGKLFSLALSGLSDTHPVEELLLVQSRHPKQEVARGLLADDTRLRSSVQGDGVFADTQAPMAGERSNLLKEYLQAFYAAFPQAGEKLLGRAFERAGGVQSLRLKTSAEIELETILDNELTDGDEFGGYVRAFAAMKRLWEI